MAKKFKWEGSKADEALDKKGAKKMGMSAKRFEGSKADKAMDKKGVKRMAGRGR
jgi:hypothetical protein